MLDSQGYLSSFGWKGKGNSLRQGSVSRPLAIPQKRTLAGLGKDRDEAFPFWDHLFAAAAKSIQIKVSRDVDSEESGKSDRASPSQATLNRTTTGILSNRRPIVGTPATSGTATPTDSQYPRLSLLTTAKRETARKRLYARFFRGPVLGPEIDHDEPTVTTITTAQAQGVATTESSPEIQDERQHERSDVTEAEEGKERKTHKNDDLHMVANGEPRRKKKRKSGEGRKERENQKGPTKAHRDEKRRKKKERRQRKASDGASEH